MFFLLGFAIDCEEDEDDPDARNDPNNQINTQVTQTRIKALPKTLLRIGKLRGKILGNPLISTP